MNKKSQLHPSPLVFDDKQTQQINQLFLRLADKIGSPLIMLADISGRLILYRGRLSAGQSTGLAALAAGSFAASVEIGSFLGLHNSFQQQLLEGKLASLYISAIKPELLLIVAFTPKTTLGMVRLFTEQTQNKLTVLVKAAIIARKKAVTTQSEALDDGFGDAVSQQLDDLFADDSF